ncbi:NAD(P)H-dependent oxidoreductase [Ancylomarina sp. 16SWW S1-10-2]|uniref:NAD(P)H-dependent oxidoreductase n=1 Tax=Ancylomarina sp. 16SWW S1-10-2 TaxID=2499681 RepID=UPI0012AE5081|nr:NAD(P)H-dependent oxidoreductase [Ancylomarina sp. 16SWW S1-10-2]MRT92923.1 NAD(P)H-dependent oxidoreductase [Ancylomarina sp. 16SWW S1-10-2]
MSFIKSMQERYATKTYDRSRKIELNKIEELKEILRLSPSSINSQPWNFTFITNSETKNELAKVSFHNTEKIENCDALVVFHRINNIQDFEEGLAERLPEGAVGYYNNFLKQLSEDQKNVWFEKQVYLALGVFLSACAEMNIDSTPMEGIEHEKYDAILGSDDYSTVVAVAIGFRDKDDFNQPEKKAKSRKALNQVIKSI